MISPSSELILGDAILTNLCSKASSNRDPPVDFAMKSVSDKEQRPVQYVKAEVEPNQSRDLPAYVIIPAIFMVLSAFQR